MMDKEDMHKEEISDTDSGIILNSGKSLTHQQCWTLNVKALDPF